jgi:hypothetical protein
MPKTIIIIPEILLIHFIISALILLCAMLTKELKIKYHNKE